LSEAVASVAALLAAVAAAAALAAAAATAVAAAAAAAGMAEAGTTEPVQLTQAALAVLPPSVLKPKYDRPQGKVSVGRRSYLMLHLHLEPVCSS
jgi:hypothetical protein